MRHIIGEGLKINWRKPALVASAFVLGLSLQACKSDNPAPVKESSKESTAPWTRDLVAVGRTPVGATIWLHVDEDAPRPVKQPICVDFEKVNPGAEGPDRCVEVNLTDPINKLGKEGEPPKELETWVFALDGSDYQVVVWASNPYKSGPATLTAPLAPGVTERS